MLESYWKIGTEHYKEYPKTKLGKMKAKVKFLMLPPCHKTIIESETKIYVGSFRGVEKAELNAFYDNISNQTEETKLQALEEVYGRHESKKFPSIANNPRLRLKLLERKIVEDLGGNMPPSIMEKELNRLVEMS